MDPGRDAGYRGEYLVPSPLFDGREGTLCSIPSTVCFIGATALNPGCARTPAYSVTACQKGRIASAPNLRPLSRTSLAYFGRLDHVACTFSAWRKTFYFTAWNSGRSSTGSALASSRVRHLDSMGRRSGVRFFCQSQESLEIPQVRRCTLTSRISGYTIAALLAAEILLALWDTKWGQKVTSAPMAVLLSLVVFGITLGIARRVQISKLGFVS